MTPTPTIRTVELAGVFVLILIGTVANPASAYTFILGMLTTYAAVSTICILRSRDRTLTETFK
jgi:hypothetical protein